ncbi:DUF4082 domain-containing protein [Candidatus Saccharibacteria bacterium]|nr:MAG: DUF4082 domain-containing protein [Candidatus Saccharibacteria bacterium]
MRKKLATLRNHIRLRPKLFALGAAIVLGIAAFGVRSSLAASCPCTVFDSSAAPSQQNINDGQPIELGMKFQADTDGTITGVRFYKGSSDTGTHTGTLWTSGGTSLGTVTFSGESAGGWQQANFQTPITVQANTTYVVSYYSSAGYYGATSNGFASAIDNTPLHGLASGGASGTNGLYRYGSTGFPTSSFNATNYYVDAVFMNNGGADTAPPTITATNPANNVTGVAASTNVTANVSEALNASTVTTSTATITAGTTSVPANVVYNTTSNSIVIDPTADLSAGVTYTAIIKGGANGVKDTAGNALASDYTWSFTTATGGSSQGCPCSIWSAADTPAGGTFTDNQTLELGTKFQATTTGYITGLKYYRPATASGNYTGSLWSANGTKLGGVTFTGTTAGWQTADLSSPVAVQTGITYTVSYNTSAGVYVADGNYFATAHTNGPLTAPASGTSGGNGVFSTGSGSMPTGSFNSTNYWADVVFSDQAVADTTPPTVASVLPTADATGVNTMAAPFATFSEPLDQTTVTTSTFTLKTAAGASVAGAVSYDISTLKASFAPSAPLNRNATYTATIKGGASGVKDNAGNALAADYTWSFTTSNALNPDQGYGGPILVVTNTGNKFSSYYAEILRAEGYNSFATADVGSLSASSLANYKVVVLGETALTDTQTTTLTDWVNGGGNLVAMRPDSRLSSLAGVTKGLTSSSDKYLQIDTSKAPGQGIVGQTMQYHGPADDYTLNGATSVATLFSDATTTTNKPAVTIRSVGSNGGHVALFAYDLAKSVVYTHQGNPAWAGDERDGSSPIRPNDLFYGAKTGDIQPDYLNLDKAAIPQADEQQRLLGNIITEVQQNNMPIAKWWYLPNGKKAAILMAADDHANGGTTGTFDRLLATDNGCNVTNWECNRSTSWMYTNTNVTPAQADSYTAQGFDLGVHVSTNCADWTPSSLSASFDSDLAGFKAKYPNLPAQTGNRTHCIAWSDWATQPKVELAHGIRLDLNYYYWPGTWVNDRAGFMSGSGIPMRLADSDGSMIDTFQVPTDLVNETHLSTQAISDFLDRATGPEGYYGIFGTHYDYSDTFDQTLQQLATQKGITMVSGKQVLDWTDARNSSTMQNMTWNNNQLSFTAQVDSRAGSMLRTMLPVTNGTNTLTSVTKDGQAVTFTTETIKGVNYAFFPGTNGNYVATYSPPADTTPPTVSNVTPTTNATGVAVDVSPTATMSEAVNATTVTSTTANLKNAAGTTITATVSYDATAKKITIDPTSNLANSTVYTATIKGGASGVKDTAGNALATDYTWSFTTAAAPVANQKSIFTNTAAPATLNANDNQAIELGTKFQSTVAGNVTAIRFYKGGSADTGTHVGSLWSSTGTKLASVTFTGETGSGWQQANLSTPVAITANTTYTVSYYSPAGYYSTTQSGLSSAITNTPVKALASGGVYKYGTSGRPTSTWSASNYFVDVVFNY